MPRYHEIPETSVLELLIAVLERLERRLERRDARDDEYRKVFLNARFPHGRATDRWAPR
jgi:hypothetical protein